MVERDGSMSFAMLPEAIGHTEAVRLALGPLCQDRHLLLFFSLAAWASLLPSGCLASRAASVAQWFVDLRAHPQTVQKYRKLPRHGHNRSLHPYSRSENSLGGGSIFMASGWPGKAMDHLGE
jgi:hypothetical protein